MQPELIVRQLVDFGLSDKEAMIYVALLTMRKVRAGEIARKLQLNRMLVYRTLARLSERELVKVTMEKPMRFVPVPMDVALKMLVKETESRLDQMKYRHDAILEEWNSMDTAPTETEALSFRVVQGRKQIYSLLGKMFKSAEKQIRLIVGVQDLTLFQYVDLDDVLRRSSKKGIKIEIMVQHGNEPLDIINNYVNFTRVRLVPMTRAMRLFIVDNRELAIAFAPYDSMTLNTRQDTCLYIESVEGKSLVTLADMFSNMWDSADEFEELVSTTSAENVRILRDEDSLRRAMNDMISGAKSGIALGIPSCLSLSDKAKLVQLVTSKPDQVPVRIDMHINSSDLPKLEENLSKADTYHTEKLENMQFLIVDRKEILVTLYLNEPRRERKCKHIWSNSGTYVDLIMNFAKDIWSKSIPFGEKIRELRRLETSRIWLSEVGSELERLNWKVHTPGHVSSKEGEVFEFSLMAEGDSGKRVAVEFIAGGNGDNLGTIASLYGKAISCGVKSLYLVFTSPVKPEEASFAEYCNIRLLEATTREKVASQIARMSA